MDDKNMQAPTPETLVEQPVDLSLSEFSQACAVRSETIVELVDEGLLSPSGREVQCWRFSTTHVRRASVAIRLQRDLGVNPAGAALALQLLDDLEALQARLLKMGMI